MVSCDICLKTLLHKYGGWGYDHILTNIIPMMQEAGITDDQINVIVNENPKFFLMMEKNSCYALVIILLPIMFSKLYYFSNPPALSLRNASIAFNL